MKNFKICKSHELSSNSKIFLHIGEKRIHIKGFGLFKISLEPGQEFHASHQWTRSKKIKYEDIKNGSSFLIRPRIGRLFIFILLIVFSICTCIFLFTKFRWSFIPLAPFAIYILLYVSLFKDRYLIIEPIKEEP
jgi:hypothetical protein